MFHGTKSAISGTSGTKNKERRGFSRKTLPLIGTLGFLADGMDTSIV
jgi:hypothetical protein